MNCYKCHTPIPDNSRFCSTCGADVSGDSHAHETVGAMEDSQLVAKLQAELGTEYILEKELGRGGMAIVYLGRDSDLGRKVAVKVLPPELTYGGGGSMIERFKREAQTAAKLDHPNIIPVYRVARGGTLFWYVMKYLDGEPLDKMLEREGQLSLARTVEIVVQVADALEYAHQNQVVHRDVKPANVVVDKRGRVTVTDFGIAKALDANTLTASGSIIGTPYYMSPEQCKGKRVGPAADQYSLAVMTYQMLGGHLPFTGDSAVEIVHKHVADPVPPLGVLRPQLPAKVIAVVERGLAKAPEERFPTVTDFARALKATSEGADAPVAPARRGAIRVSKTALVSPVPGALRTARGTWRDRKGLVIGSVGAVLVAAAVLAVTRPWQRPASPLRQDLGAAGGAVVPPDSSAASRAPVPAPSESAAKEPTPAPQITQPSESPALATPPPTRAASRRPAGPHRAVTTESRPQEIQPPQAAGQPAPSPAAPSPAAQAQPVQETAKPPSQPAASGWLYVTAEPIPTTITVNGQPYGRSINHAFPPGTYHLHFEGADLQGQWFADTTVEVHSGLPTRLPHIQLRIRRP